tara:strand:- start:640 stop:2241 length:1602 start_codon:yes stop_codon:yes gene_type:complete
MVLSHNEERDLYVALTRFNYFPNQKENMGELPPCFSTRQFTPEVCEEIATLNKSRKRKNSGFDAVEFRATRYNNVSRTLTLIHPKAYSDLTKHIIDNWASLRHISENENSHIKPNIREDGRVFVMNYENPLSKKRRIIQSSFAKKVQVSTDIANCFNSVYSHSIAWAIVGLETAKTNRRSNGLWYNQMDIYTRACKRNETQGIPIGAGTSSIIIETILSRIDSKLREKEYTFERYVDDYTCYCSSESQSEAFIIDLEHMLAEFKLSLNLGKTTVSKLPSHTEDDWVLELLSCIPATSIIEVDGIQTKVYFAPECLTFINQALKINEKTPDGSVLKYAMQLIVSHLEEGGADTVFQQILNLSWHYPILIPFLDKLCVAHQINLESYEHQLNEIIVESAIKRRSDGMCWPLHIMYSHELKPSDEAIKKVIESEDCLALTLVVSYWEYIPAIKSLVDSKITNDLYSKDNYWVLLYQLFINDLIANPYDDETFNILKRHNVNFLPGENKTEAEAESDRIAASFIFPPITDSLPSSSS